MRAIAGDETGRLTRDGDLKKGLVIWIRQDIRQQGRGCDDAAALDVVQESGNLVDPKLELGTMEDFVVFGHDACVETQRQFTRGDHADNLGARPEG